MSPVSQLHKTSGFWSNRSETAKISTSCVLAAKKTYIDDVLFLISWKNENSACGLWMCITIWKYSSPELPIQIRKSSWQNSKRWTKIELLQETEMLCWLIPFLFRPPPENVMETHISYMYLMFCILYYNVSNVVWTVV